MTSSSGQRDPGNCAEIPKKQPFIDVMLSRADDALSELNEWMNEFYWRKSVFDDGFTNFLQKLSFQKEPRSEAEE